ncbi:MAG: aminotransferase class V-fold PLP-dependent enzyme, partial [Thermoanaerobaculia bacterium]|nr:aminotransferase class V-fold PLP-dependent enzyme [Thermoanaerobaculia bacterium]
MAFGSQIRGEWSLDDGLVYLNHGTVGVTPNRVLAAQAEIRREIETNPSRKLLREIIPLTLAGDSGPGRLRLAAAEAAGLFGARGEDVAFVDNATTGVNAVLQSLDLGPGDRVVITETTYGGVSQAVRYACRRAG